MSKFSKLLITTAKVNEDIDLSITHAYERACIEYSDGEYYWSLKKLDWPMLEFSGNGRIVKTFKTENGCKRSLIRRLSLFIKS